MTREKQLLNEVEAAEEIAIQPQTLSAWRCRGFGPPFLKIGRSVRYRRSDLESWMESRTATCATRGN